ncbi:MAG: ABC transporter ATP-binding protein [Muribaculaceae bacterium]|nr:ABC transporter ATP-binding protein [Muribaculaceae bacterium]
MSDIVLDFNNVSKLYSLRSVGAGTLSDDLKRWWQMRVKKEEDPFELLGEENIRSKKGNTNFVWALKDVSFQVRQGEVVGIMGQNGSGKSTLLKILSHITTPTRGYIGIKGRVASLLEVGTGFHPDLTGRENIFMNGTILGMSHNDIKRRFDEIVDFAGIDRYIDTPVKRYSSGMTVRLGFSIATFLLPEILVVDEVLAVGDMAFKKKAINKMLSISQDEGRTVLFVTHSTRNMQLLCSRGIVLDSGHMKYDGDIRSAVRKYLSEYAISNGYNDEALPLNTQYVGIDGDPAIIALTRAVLSSTSTNDGAFENSSPIELEFDVVIGRQMDEIVIGFNIYSQYDSPLARADYNDINQIKTLSPGKYRFCFVIPPYTLAPGSYKIVFDIQERHVARQTTENSNLMFDVVSGIDNFGNVFPRVSQRKSSLIHENWVVGMERIE